MSQLSKSHQDLATIDVLQKEKQLLIEMLNKEFNEYK
jgi:hypothetical protein